MFTEDQRKEKHEKAKNLEVKLIDLIAESQNEHLMDVFIEWQDTREELNKDWVEYMESLVT